MITYDIVNALWSMTKAAPGYCPTLEAISAAVQAPPRMVNRAMDLLISGEASGCGEPWVYRRGGGYDLTTEGGLERERWSSSPSIRENNEKLWIKRAQLGEVTSDAPIAVPTGSTVHGEVRDRERQFMQAARKMLDHAQGKVVEGNGGEDEKWCPGCSSLLRRQDFSGTTGVCRVCDKLRKRRGRRESTN